MALVTYSDGSPETVDQYATDVAAFLMWAAEPHLVARKRLGFQVMVFLARLRDPHVPHQAPGLGVRRALTAGVVAAQVARASPGAAGAAMIAA